MKPYLRAAQVVPRPHPLQGKRDLVNIDTFLGFVGGVVYLVSHGAKTDWSGQKRGQSHNKRKP